MLLVVFHIQATKSKRQNEAAKTGPDWLNAVHRNVLAIALANKLARIAWDVLARGRGFEARPAVASRGCRFGCLFFPCLFFPT